MENGEQPIQFLEVDENSNPDKKSLKYTLKYQANPDTAIPTQLEPKYKVRKYNEENGRSIGEQLSPEVLTAMETYAWPGNVRELETAIERAVIVARTNELTMECLREEIIKPNVQSRTSGSSADNAAALDLTRGISFYDEVSRFEIELIRRALDITGGHQSRAAKLLGMNNTTLNSKIKVYNIKL